MNREKIGGRLIVATLLIAVGVVLLLSNLGVITGGIWDNLIRLWPILLIALGVNSLIQQREIFGPTIAIVLGLSLLLGNFDLVSPLAWGILIGLWPLLLIAGGLEVINHRRSIWAAILSTAALVAVTFAVFWYTGAITASPEEFTRTENISVPLDEIESAEITLSPGVGYLELDGEAVQGILVAGSVPESAGEPTGTIAYEESAGVGKFTYSEEGDTVVLPWAGGSQSYSFHLSQSLPLSLTISLGVGFELLDLSAVEIEGLEVNSGIAISEVVLPAEGNLTGEVRAGIGQTTIRIPEGLAIRIRMDTGLVIVMAPDEFAEEDNIYSSPDFREGEAGINLTINQAIGLVRIEVVKER